MEHQQKEDLLLINFHVNQRINTLLVNQPYNNLHLLIVIAVEGLVNDDMHLLIDALKTDLKTHSSVPKYP